MLTLKKTHKTYKSVVWTHFGFVNGDKSKVSCLKCKAVMKYSGNTTSMSSHLKRHHPELSTSAVGNGSGAVPAKQMSAKQPTLEQNLNCKFHKQSNRARQISDAIGELLFDCLLPYSRVENSKFRELDVY